MQRSMFVVLLRFSDNRGMARQLMASHTDWIQRGLDDGIFLVVGGLEPNLGGAIVAHGLTRPDLEARIGTDPFVAHDVVRSEVLELSPSKTAPQLAFLRS
jgi:uncharacterized protein YciI